MKKLGKVDSLAAKSEIPSQVSELANDTGYTTESYVQTYAQPKGDYALKSDIADLQRRLNTLINILMNQDLIKCLECDEGLEYDLICHNPECPTNCCEECGEPLEAGVCGNTECPACPDYEEPADEIEFSITVDLTGETTEHACTNGETWQDFDGEVVDFTCPTCGNTDGLTIIANEDDGQVWTEGCPGCGNYGGALLDYEGNENGNVSYDEEIMGGIEYTLTGGEILVPVRIQDNNTGEIIDEGAANEGMTWSEYGDGYNIICPYCGDNDGIITLYAAEDCITTDGCSGCGAFAGGTIEHEGVNVMPEDRITGDVDAYILTGSDNQEVYVSFTIATEDGEEIIIDAEAIDGLWGDEVGREAYGMNCPGCGSELANMNFHATEEQIISDGCTECGMFAGAVLQYEGTDVTPEDTIIDQAIYVLADGEESTP